MLHLKDSKFLVESIILWVLLFIRLTYFLFSMNSMKTHTKFDIKNVEIRIVLYEMEYLTGKHSRKELIK